MGLVVAGGAARRCCRRWRWRWSWSSCSLSSAAPKRVEGNINIVPPPQALSPLHSPHSAMYPLSISLRATPPAPRLHLHLQRYPAAACLPPPPIVPSTGPRSVLTWSNPPYGLRLLPIYEVVCPSVAEASPPSVVCPSVAELSPPPPPAGSQLGLLGLFVAMLVCVLLAVAGWFFQRDNRGKERDNRGKVMKMIILLSVYVVMFFLGAGAGTWTDLALELVKDWATGLREETRNFIIGLLLADMFKLVGCGNGEGEA